MASGVTAAAEISTHLERAKEDIKEKARERVCSQDSVTYVANGDTHRGFAQKERPTEKDRIAGSAISAKDMGILGGIAQ